jgi:hypothetical protein
VDGEGLGVATGRHRRITCAVVLGEAQKHGRWHRLSTSAAARIRMQMSVALTEAVIDFAIAAFTDAGKALGIV